MFGNSSSTELQGKDTEATRVGTFIVRLMLTLMAIRNHLATKYQNGACPS